MSLEQGPGVAILGADQKERDLSVGTRMTNNLIRKKKGISRKKVQALAVNSSFGQCWD